MKTPLSQHWTLASRAKHQVFERVIKALEANFYKLELLDATWRASVESHRVGIEGAPDQDAFESAMTTLLQTLKVSHLGFFTGPRRGRRAEQP